MILGGLAILTLSAEVLVRSASRIAATLGVPSLVVGLTVVAYGTSMPELSVSMVSTVAGNTSIVLGNVIGSNIFNVLGVLGLSALIGPGQGLPVTGEALSIDLLIMGLVAVSCLPVFFSGGTITRLEGGLFLLYYLGYTLLLVLRGIGASPIPSAWGFTLLFSAPLLIAAGLTLLTRRQQSDT